MKHTIGLIGNPVEHSRSPELFQLFFEKSPDKSWQYNLWRITDINSILHQINEESLRGFNITLPHKTTIIPQLQYLSSDALAIQAVNTAIALPNNPEAMDLFLRRLESSSPKQTIKTTLAQDSLPLSQKILPGFNANIHKILPGFNTDIHKILLGFNTDILGFLDSVLEAMSINPSFSASTPANEMYSRAIVIGNGGSAKAVLHALNSLGIPIIQYSRTENISSNVKSMEALTSLSPLDQTLWINTTPLGMHPQHHSMPQVPPSSIHPSDTLIDLIYNPEETQLMKLFLSSGAIAKNGFTMLRSQAHHAWQLFKLSAEISELFQ